MTLLASPSATAAASAPRAARLGALIASGALLVPGTVTVVSMAAAHAHIVHAVGTLLALH